MARPCPDAVPGGEEHQEDLEAPGRPVGQRVVEVVAGELQVGERPGDRQQVVHRLAPPAPRGQREELGRGVDAGAAGQGERGGEHRHAPCILGHGAHAVPVDGGPSFRRVADDHGEVGDPSQPDEAVMGLPCVRRQHDQLVGERQPEGGRARAGNRLAALPQRARVERRHPLRGALQAVVQLQDEGRHVVVGQDGVVVVAAAGAYHPPPGAGEGRQRALVLAARQQDVDVLHGAQSGLGIAGGHRRPFEDHRFQPGVGQRAHRQRHRPGDEQHRLHAEGIGHAAEDGTARPELFSRVGRTEGPPQQRGDPVLHGGGQGAFDVGTAGEGTPERGRIGITAAGLPEQLGRRLGHAQPRRRRARRCAGSGSGSPSMPSRWGNGGAGPCMRWLRARDRVFTGIARFATGGGKKARALALPRHCSNRSAPLAAGRFGHRTDQNGPLAAGGHGTVDDMHSEEPQRDVMARRDGATAAAAVGDGRTGRPRLSRRQAMGRMSAVATAGAVAWVVPEILTAKPAAGAALSNTVGAGGGAVGGRLDQRLQRRDRGLGRRQRHRRHQRARRT